MVRLIPIAAPASRHLLCVAALLLAVCAAAQDMAAAEDNRVLDPRDAARFMNSLPGMIALRDDLAGRAQSLETGDDPIQPFAMMPDDATGMRARIERHLARHGFAGLDDWRAAGQPLMDAYWALRARGRMASLAGQMAPLALAVRGVESPTRHEIAEMSGRLYDRMAARNRARVPEDNTALARKYRTRISRLLTPETETSE